MDFGKILEALKLSPRYLIPVVVTSGVIIYAPDHFIENLGLVVFRDQYRSWLGASFLLSSAIVLTSLLSDTIVWLKKKVRGGLFYWRGKRYLGNLTPSERRILSAYIDENTRTQSLLLDDGVVRGLAAAGIIYQASELGDLLTGFAFNIQPWAWRYLKRNLRVLSGDD